MKFSKTFFSGVLMLAATVLALTWASSPWKHLYEEIIHLDVFLGIGEWSMNKSIQHWVNDGLMAVFFFYIGLELKREFRFGVLTSLKRALLPVMMAVGGALVPAFIYFAINFDTPFLKGWAIPIATDVAFALAIASMFRKSVSSAFIVLLMGVAVVDDLMSVIVIASAYTSDIAFFPLAFAAGGFGLLMVLNRFNVQQEWLYMLIGVVVIWFPMLQSGIHPTLAGVLTAICIPSVSNVSKDQITEDIQKSGQQLLRSFEGDGNKKIMTEEEFELLDDVETKLEHAISPMQQIERELKSVTYLFILPVFAFANIGIDLSIGLENPFGNTIFMAVILGLVVGKPIGILSMAYLGKLLGIVHFPPGIKFFQMLGLSCLAGIGFTMSLFIADLAFDDFENVIPANLGILIGSNVSALIFVLLAKPFMTKRH